MRNSNSLRNANSAQANDSEVEFDSISDNFIEDGLVDNLYVLKSSLVRDKKLTKDSHSCISQIALILEDHPEMCQTIYKWDFLQNEGLYCLRSEFLFLKALKIVKMTMVSCAKAPELYFSKKFLFFISEKLYFSLGGARQHFPQSKLSAINYDDFIETDVNCKEEASISEHLRHKPYEISQETREIIDFCRALIEIDESSITILHELKFFDICNTVITVESARLFNSVFRDLYYKNKTAQETPERPWERDGLYEIQRKLFDPEIIFRAKNILYHKRALYKYKNGVYVDVYKECTNWRTFAELSVKDFIDFLLYKRVVFMSDDISTILREEINIKVLRFYRRSLEEGGHADGGYLPFLLKNIEEKEVSREICLILYYFTDFITDFKKFTEQRIRVIFETLEYVCELECNKQDRIQTRQNQAAQAGQGFSTLAGFDAPSEIPDGEIKSIEIRNISSRNASFSSSLCSNDIFGDGASKTQFQMPCDIKKQAPRADVLGEEVNSNRRNCSENILEADVDAYDTENFSERLCERLRILKLIKFLYNSMNKELFYKPSYLILLRSTYNHCISEKNFIDEYFSDFLLYLNSDGLKIAECLFLTKFTTRQPKMIEFRLSDDLMDIKASDDKENSGNNLVLGSEETELNFTRRGSKKTKSSNEFSDADGLGLFEARQLPENITFAGEIVDEDFNCDRSVNK